MRNKTLKALFILQEANNVERKKNNLNIIGRGFNKAYRLNPFNPLSYVAFVVLLVIGIFMFGFVGIQREFDGNNPFKWN